MCKNNESCYVYSELVVKEIVKRDDEHTKQVIKDYYKRKYPNENVRIDFLDEEVVDEIIRLGIAEYQQRQAYKEFIKKEKENE